MPWVGVHENFPRDLFGLVIERKHPRSGIAFKDDITWEAFTFPTDDDFAVHVVVFWPVVPIVFETRVQVFWDPVHLPDGLAGTGVGGGVLPTFGWDREVVGFSEFPSCH